MHVEIDCAEALRAHQGVPGDLRKIGVQGADLRGIEAHRLAPPSPSEAR